MASSAISKGPQDLKNPVVPYFYPLSVYLAEKTWGLRRSETEQENGNHSSLVPLTN